MQSAGKRELLRFLLEHFGEPIPVAEWQEVLQTLRELVFEVIKKQHDDTRQLGWKALNDRMKEAGIHYAIAPCEDGSFVIEA